MNLAHSVTGKAKKIINYLLYVTIIQLIFIIPVFLVFKRISTSQIYEIIYFNFVFAIVTFINHDWRYYGDKSPGLKKKLILLIIFISFLYLTEVNLCVKLQWTSIYSHWLCSAFGKALLLICLLVQLNTFKIKPHLFKRPMVSFYLAICTYLTGYALIQKVWLPILSVPGILVSLKWYHKSENS